jgi:hypothetical protein
MSKADFDVAIIGSGPAGVSAAYPLVSAGLKILLIDGGKTSTNSSQIPSLDNKGFIEARLNDADQWKWMVGNEYEALTYRNASSPKFRVPQYKYVFEDFIKKNQIVSDNFISIGSLSKGGLSNAWGCGVAKYSFDELSNFPCDPGEMEASYKVVSERIGMSGKSSDDLSTYFRLDDFCQPAIPMDERHNYIYSKYLRGRDKLDHIGFKLGRSRVAALSENFSGRYGCNRCSNCLWGCIRGSLYSAANEFESLRKYQNFNEASGLLVDEIESKDGLNLIHCEDLNKGNTKAIRAKRVLVAAGTLATTRIIFNSLKFTERVALLSCPTAAYMVWLPKFFARPFQNSFGLGQLSFSLILNSGISGFGSTFSTVGIPISEFANYLPTGRRYGIDILSSILSSCIVGNLFLPGKLSNASVVLNDRKLIINGGDYSKSLDYLQESKIKLQRIYRILGGFIVPLSFKYGLHGSDVHYCGTLPMKKIPKIGETNEYGEVIGMHGVSAIDGASLPLLSEKSHTLTIMANADRIGRKVAKELCSKK